MSGRPGDWSALGESHDPVGGDLHQVAEETRYYSDMAAELRAQAANLRRIGADDTLVGASMNSLRGTANEMASRLERLDQRYSVVAAQLGVWQPALDAAQGGSLAALRRAEAARQRLHALENQPPTIRSADPPTPEQVEARLATERRHEAAVDAAHDELRAARRQLEEVLETRDMIAREVARNIIDGLEDGVSDSWLDSAKEFVHDHADTLAKIAEVLSAVATALAIIALFIPGLNIIALIAIGLTVGALSIHSALAVSGDGSWVDVGLDVFALATLGTGNALVGAARAGRSLAMLRAGELGAGGARAAVTGSRRAAHPVLSRFSDWASSVPLASRLGLGRYSEKTAALADRAAFEAFMANAFRRLPPTTAAERLIAGGNDIAPALLKDYRMMGRAYRGDEVVEYGASLWWMGASGARQSYAAGAFVDLIDKVLGESKVVKRKPSVDEYERFKDDYRVEIGSTW